MSHLRSSVAHSIQSGSSAFHPCSHHRKEAQDSFTGTKGKLSSSNGSEIHCFFFQYYIKEVYTFYQEKSLRLFPQPISILKTIIRICPLLYNIVFTYKAQTSFLPSFYVNESFACIYICVSCACSFCRCQEKVPDPLKLELQVMVSLQMGARN